MRDETFDQRDDNELLHAIVKYKPTQARETIQQYLDELILRHGTDKANQMIVDHIMSQRKAA